MGLMKLTYEVFQEQAHAANRQQRSLRATLLQEQFGQREQVGADAGGDIVSGHGDLQLTLSTGRAGPARRMRLIGGAVGQEVPVWHGTA